MLYKKCKYYKKCEWVNKEGYTCRHESDADGYCGSRKKNEKELEKENE